MDWLQDFLDDDLGSWIDEDVCCADDDDDTGGTSDDGCPLKYAPNGTLETLFCLKKCVHGDCDHMTKRQAKAKLLECRAWGTKLPSGKR